MPSACGSGRPKISRVLFLGVAVKGEVAGVGQQLARLHQAVDAVLEGLPLLLFPGLGKGPRHGRAGAAPLAGVGLVDDDGEAAPALLVADLVEDEGELLDRRDDDLLAALDEPPQVAGAVGGPHRRRHLRILPDGVADLAVEEDAVRDDDDGVEDRGALPGQPDQLVGEPGDGVALAAAGRVLDQVAAARAAVPGVGQQAAHHVELMVAGPDLGPLPPARLLVLRHDHLGVVLEDVGQALPAQHLPPQVVGLDAAGVGRVAGAVVPAAVEGQEPGGLAGEAGAELDLALVHGEVGDAAARLEQLLARVAVALVLLDGVVDRLLGEAVLQLEGEDRQAVDEQADVEGPLGLVAAVAQLAGDGEAVLPEALLRLRVVGRGGAVEQVEVVGPVPDAVAQHVDGAALADLPLEPGQEAAAGGAGLGQVEGLGRFGLGGAQEGGELGQVDAVLAVVVVVVAARPADAAVVGRRFAYGGLWRRVAGIAGQGRAD